MKAKLATMILSLAALSGWAQSDSTTYKCKIVNDEYQVYMDINFYDNDILVPGQEIFGKIAGYFGDYKDSRKWFITDAQIEGKTAHLAITNDYGSEDLTADLTVLKDGSYELKQTEGSAIKIARNRKWVKIPKKLVFHKK